MTALLSASRVATRTGPAGRLPDLRLVALALATWLSALAALQLRAPAAVAVGGVALLAAAVAWRWLGRTGWLAVLVAVLLGVACGSLATAPRLAARDAAAVARPAQDRALVTMELTVRRDPHQLRPAAGRPPTWLVPARVHRIGAASDPAAGTVRVRARVLVFGSDPQWQPLLPGQRVRATGRLGPPERGDLTAAVLSVTDPPELLGQPPWVQRAAGSLRAGLQAAADPLPDQPGGLLPGLAVGDVSALDPSLSTDFDRTGLSHLIAVSGANVAIVVGCVALLAGAARAPRWLNVCLCAVALAGFVVLCRADPSVLRAGAMGAIALVALASGRPRAAMPALAATVTALVVFDPQLAGDPGMAMSVLATGGLLLLAPRWRDALRRRGVPRGAAEAVAIPAAAQVAVAPVIAGLSGQVSLVAVAANLVATPAVAPATVLGVLAAVVSPVWPPAAELLAWLASWPAWWLVLVARYGSGVPAAAVPWPGGVTGGLLLAALTLAGLLALRHRRVRVLVAVLTVAVVAGAVPVRMVASGWPPAGLLVAACAVGQGDLLVLPVAAGQAVVVDTGPDPAEADRCLRDLRVRSVPLLVVSHYHADHVGGIEGVFRGRRVAAVLVPDWPEPAAGHDQVVRAATAGRTPVTVTRAGSGFRVGELSLTVLGPPSRLAGTRSDPNNNSLVVRADRAGVRILLTGDAEEELQSALLDRLDAGQLRAEVLKLAHHGSAFQEPAFLAAVDPAVALVPVGADNRHGHPHPGLLDRLARDGARVLRTDRDGDLAVVRQDGALTVVTRTPTSGRGRPPPVSSRAGFGRVRGRRATGGACDDSRVSLDRVVLVLGEEELLAVRAVAGAVEAARTVDAAVEVRDLEAGALSAGELAELLSPSLFGGARVVVVQRGQDARKDLVAALLAYAAAPDPDVTLVIVHAGGAKGKPLADGLRQAGATVVPAGKVTRHRERVEFVRGEIRRLGGRCGEDAAEALLAAVGSDLRELAAACSQLVADTGGRVDAATVARYYRGRAEVSGFTVADAAMVGDTAGALEALRWALQVGVPVVPIADALADGVRTVARVASAGRGSAYQLAGRLGLPPWKVERGQRQARGWSPEGLVEAMQVAAECNAAVKGGGEDSGYALERAVVAVAAAQGGGR